MFRYLLFLSLIHSALATEPRLSLVEKFTQLGILFPELVDLDGDGDLDLYSGSIVRVGTDRLWVENLGNGRLSSSKAIGFGDSSVNDFLMQLDDDPAIEILAEANSFYHPTPPFHFPFQVIEPLENEMITVRKIISAGPADAVIPVHLERDFSPQFIFLTENDDGSVKLVFRTLKEKQFFEPWSTQAINITHPKSDDIHKARAIDLDNDGDRDLLLDAGGPTFIVERIGPNEFAADPIYFSGDYSYLADFDNDGSIELHDTSCRTYIEKTSDGTFQFDLKNHPSDIRDVGPSEYLQKGVQQNLVEIDYLDDGLLVIEEYTLSQLGEITLDFSQVIPPENRQGDLLFGPQHRYFSADFDNDGTFDLILWEDRSFRNFRASESSVLIFKRNEDGYQLVSSPPPYHDLLNDIVESGDFDEDGDIDLLIGPDGLGQIGFFKNDGDGNFSEAPARLDLMPASLDRSIYTISGLYVSDLNEDGHSDLAVSYEELGADYGSPVQAAHTLIYGNGDGTFSSASLPVDAFQAMPASKISTMVDWDRDGDLDAIVEGGWLENVEGILSATRTQLLENASISNALGNPLRLPGYHIGDIDGDGHPDFIASVYELSEDELNNTHNSKLGVAFNDGSGGIEAISTFPANIFALDALGNPLDLGAAPQDMNLDGRDNLLLPTVGFDQFGNPIIESVRLVQTNQDNPRDLDNTQIEIIDLQKIPTFHKWVDFDGDGSLELGQADTWIRPTTDGLELGPTYDFTQLIDSSVLTPILVEDLDGDGDLDSIQRKNRYPYRDRLILVRNTLIDERSSITTDLIALGQTPPSATPEADPDEDGLNNSQEYLLGTDPLTSDAALVRDLTPQWSADRQSLTFQRRKDRANHALFYDLEASDDLIFWSPTSLANATVTDDGPNWENVTLDLSSSSPARFFRVSAFHDPSR